MNARAQTKRTSLTPSTWPSRRPHGTRRPVSRARFVPGPAGRDGAGAAVVGALPDTSMSATATESNDYSQAITVGTVGPFTVKLQCQSSTFDDGVNWQTFATVVAVAPDMPAGYLVGAEAGFYDSTGLAFGTVDMPAVGKLGMIATVNATKNSCSVTNVKTYLTS